MPQLFIIAHAPLARAFQSVAAHVYADLLAEQPWLLGGHDVLSNDEPEHARVQAAAALQAFLQLERPLDDPAAQGALLLTDVFGATPYNLARRLADAQGLRLLVGLNVPMLWRAINYRARSAEELAGLAADGAGQGIMQLGSTRPQNQVQPPNTHEATDGHHQQ